MKYLLAFTLLFSSQLSFAKTFKIDAEFSVSTFEDGELDTTGWKETEDDMGDTVYTQTILVDEAQLPHSISIGDAYLEISKTGNISMGISVGDADSSADSSLQWPSDANGFVSLEKPLEFKVSGGDHASGSWNINAKALISVLP